MPLWGPHGDVSGGCSPIGHSAMAALVLHLCELPWVSLRAAERQGLGKPEFLGSNSDLRALPSLCFSGR